VGSRWNAWEFESQGGSHVGRILKNLSLVTSQIDGSVDGVAGIGYLEWTLEFANGGPRQREARATVMLPKDAVVSRVTLWINGEPREAAFGTRSATTAAYQSVVRARRDPLLVTTAGPDRILVQCFPIPSNGRMKIRLGITAPLRKGTLSLPRFVERNFTLAGRHQVWVDSGTSTFRQAVAGEALGFSLPLPSQKMSDLSWTPDPLDSRRIVIQRIERRARRRFSNLVFVVDGSAALKHWAGRLRDQLPPEVILAGDHVRKGRVSELVFAGGTDNVEALLAAQREAASLADAAIVWIHGPQPLALSPPESLRQFWTRRPGAVRLYSIQVVPGPNRILAALDGLPEVRTLAVEPDDLLREFTSPLDEWVAVRERVQRSASVGHRTSAHLARLWAFEEAGRTGDAALASRYRIVTPVTGSVVLETAQQYQAAGLSPAPPGSVPTIPEPETWALMLVALLGVIWYARHR
jgi:hypothetical protein